MKTIILVGVPGCGKSSIIKEVIRQVPTTSVINYGDKMLESAASEGLSRDLLRKMPVAEQQKIGVKAAKKILQEKSAVTIIDTHALIKTDIGFCPGLPREVLEILSPNALVWIECDPALILQRRKGDTSRKRDAETQEELTLHQELTRTFLTACCVTTNAILCRVVNNSADIKQNVEPLVRLINKLF